MQNPNFPMRSESLGSQPPEVLDDDAPTKDKKKIQKKKLSAVDVLRSQESEKGSEDKERESIETAHSMRPLSELFSRTSPSNKQGDETVIFRSSRQEDQSEVISDGDESLHETEASAAEAGEDQLGPLEELDIAAEYTRVRHHELQRGEDEVTSRVEEKALQANTYLMESLSQKIEQAIRAQEQPLPQHEAVSANLKVALDAAFTETVVRYAPEATNVDGTLSTVSEQDVSNRRFHSEDVSSTPYTAQAEEFLATDEGDTAATAAMAVGAGSIPPYQHAGVFGASSMSSRWNAVPAPASSTHAEITPANMHTERTADWLAPAAVGAVIGYWIGRRGKNKAERRHVAEKKKLEGEVATLLSTITTKEAQIRQLVRAQESPTYPRVTVTGNALQQTPKAEVSTSRPLEQPSSRITPEASSPGNIEASTALGAAEHSHGVSTHAAELPYKRTVDVPRAEAAVRRAVPAEEMSHKELVEASAAIVIGSGSLQHMYERKEISELGLRRLVAEHQYGGDMGHALKDEMLKQELHFERVGEQDDISQGHERLGKEATAAQRLDTQPILPVLAITPEHSVSPADTQSSSGPMLVPPPPKAQARTHYAIQPILVAANVGAFIVLAILLTVFIIIRF